MKNNEYASLQAQVVSKFRPQFAPGAQLLYSNDAPHEALIFAKADLQELGLTITRKHKLPGIILYDKPRDRLFLIETDTSHGPITVKRRAELAAMCKKCRANPIFVTAFASFAACQEHLTDVAWDTVVWVASEPAHLIHFDRDPVGYFDLAYK
jgi:hypothetical protein